MAARAFDVLQVLGKGVRVLAGSFRPNAASAIDNTLNKGLGWSVARTGVGAYTVTLQDGFVGALAIIPSVQVNTLLKGCVQLTGAVDVTTAKTFVIQYQEESAGALAAAEIASNANNWVHFVAFLRNSELL
jgi:hypothetical protein